jgi:hypothetical protein
LLQLLQVVVFCKLLLFGTQRQTVCKLMLSCLNSLQVAVLLKQFARKLPASSVAARKDSAGIKVVNPTSSPKRKSKAGKSWGFLTCHQGHE